MKLSNMKSSQNMFKKSMVALVISAGMYTATSQAHEHNSCNVNLEAGFSVNESKIQFLEKESYENSDGKEINRVIYTITNDNSLIVSDKNIELTKEQKILVKQYATHIRKLIPEVRTVALEGVELALEGVNVVFNGLLGEDNSISADLTSDLIEIRDEVKERFTIKHGFTVGIDGKNGENLIESEIEERIKLAVDKAIKNSMGAILMAVGKEMMSSDNTDSFEDKMERFGENMEHEMEARAEVIEKKAESLCLAVVEIDKIETQLQNTIEALEDINVLTAKMEKS